MIWHGTTSQSGTRHSVIISWCYCCCYRSHRSLKCWPVFQAYQSPHGIWGRRSLNCFRTCRHCNLLSPLLVHGAEAPFSQPCPVATEKRLGSNAYLLTEAWKISQRAYFEKRSFAHLASSSFADTLGLLPLLCQVLTCLYPIVAFVNLGIIIY